MNDAGQAYIEPRARECLECGRPLDPSRRTQQFCPGSDCRRAWHNRRQMRGAILYDFYMAHRFQRAEATEAGLLQKINRQVSEWRIEDREKRAGRRSWRLISEALGDRPFLRAVVSNLRPGK